MQTLSRRAPINSKEKHLPRRLNKLLQLREETLTAIGYFDGQIAELNGKGDTQPRMGDNKPFLRILITDDPETGGLIAAVENNAIYYAKIDDFECKQPDYETLFSMLRHQVLARIPEGYDPLQEGPNDI